MAPGGGGGVQLRKHAAKALWLEDSKGNPPAPQPSSVAGSLGQREWRAGDPEQGLLLGVDARVDPLASTWTPRTTQGEGGSSMPRCSNLHRLPPRQTGTQAPLTPTQHRHTDSKSSQQQQQHTHGHLGRGKRGTHSAVTCASWEAADVGRREPKVTPDAELPEPTENSLLSADQAGAGPKPRLLPPNSSCSTTEGWYRMVRWDRPWAGGEVCVCGRVRNHAQPQPKAARGVSPAQPNNTPSSEKL
jgi:hypothetical protein